MSKQIIDQLDNASELSSVAADLQDEMVLVELEERLEFTQATDGRCNGNGSDNHVVVV